jgi:hypothetical protein
MVRICIFSMVLSVCGLLADVPLQLDYIYPSGCQRGSSCQIEVGGNWAGNTLVLGSSGRGVAAVYTGAVYAMVPVKSSKKFKKNKKVKYTKKALPGCSLLNVSVDPESETGVREMYIKYRYEVSNPLKFDISDYEEITEPATNRLSGSLINIPTLPVCLNGRIFGDKPDCYRFEAESGQKIVAFFKSEMMPLGGFVPEFQIADSNGLLVTNVVFVFFKGSAPVLVYDVALSGDYTLQISDRSGQGGRSSVYRVVLGELPLITDFSPRCVTRGESENVKLTGVNLEKARVRLFTGGKDAAMCMQTIAGNAFVLPGLSFDLYDESVVSVQEPNDSADKAFNLEMPVVLQGDFDPATPSVDFFSFYAAQATELYLDLKAGAASPKVTVRDATGAVVASGNSQKLSAVENMLREGEISFAVNCVKEGRFTIEVAFNPETTTEKTIYQMRVGAPIPDYEIWMNPVTMNISRYGSRLVDLYVHRIHGYDAPISVSAAFPPLGIISNGGHIAPDEEHGLVTVWTDAYRNPRTVFYQELFAESQFNGELRKKIVRPFTVQSCDNGSQRVSFFKKSPTFVAYYAPGMLINMYRRGKLVLSKDIESEISLVVKNTKGNLLEDFDYTVIQPTKGVIVKSRRASKAKDVLRLSITLAADSDFKTGDKADLIIGLIKKESVDGELITASQAIGFICK